MFAKRDLVMTVNELYEFFIKKSGVRLQYTCDGILAGNKDAEVISAMTCFKATAEVIKKAIEKNVSLLICHEPMFAFSERREEAKGYDIEKWKLLDSSPITVLRLHDYAHTIQPDYIHDGFISKMGLKIKTKFPNESLGISRYEIEGQMMPSEIVNLAKTEIGAVCPRIVGDKEMPVRYICLALGSVGAEQVRILEREDCDMLITGEIDEVNSCNYLRDLNSFGVRGSMLLLGHCTSEWAGMAKMADDIQKELGISCEYVHCGEVY